MKIIGITGKSGSGKTYIAERLAEKLNAKVFSFDIFSHFALETESIKTFAKEFFGDEVFDGENLDRKKIGNIVFYDKNKLDVWNEACEIVMCNLIDEALTTVTEDCIIFEYALLPLMKYFDMCNIKILVDADLRTRFSRLSSRDNIGKDYLERREANSIDYEKFNFDITFTNSGNKENNISQLAQAIKETL